jgi:hypothetical protein
MALDTEKQEIISKSDFFSDTEVDKKNLENTTDISVAKVQDTDKSQSVEKVSTQILDETLDYKTQQFNKKLEKIPKQKDEQTVKESRKTELERAKKGDFTGFVYLSQNERSELNTSQRIHYDKIAKLKEKYDTESMAIDLIQSNAPQINSFSEYNQNTNKVLQILKNKTEQQVPSKVQSLSKELPETQQPQINSFSEYNQNTNKVLQVLKNKTEQQVSSKVQSLPRQSSQTTQPLNNNYVSDSFSENVNAFTKMSDYRPQINTSQQKYSVEDINVNPTYQPLQQDNGMVIPHRLKMSYVDELNDDYKTTPKWKSKFG